MKSEQEKPSDPQLASGSSWSQDCCCSTGSTNPTSNTADRQGPRHTSTSSHSAARPAPSHHSARQTGSLHPPLPAHPLKQHRPMTRRFPLWQSGLFRKRITKQTACVFQTFCKCVIKRSPVQERQRPNWSHDQAVFDGLHILGVKISAHKPSALA